LSAGLSRLPASGQYEYSFSIFDWHPAWIDFDLFRRVIDQARTLGYNKIELGVPWNSTQPSRSDLDFSLVDQRANYVLSTGLRCRFRINAQEPPLWFRSEVHQLPDGTTFDKVYGANTNQPGIPSFFDSNALTDQIQWVEAVVRHYAGQSHEFSLGVGLHFELKYGGWNTYENAAVTEFRRWLVERYGDIAEVRSAWAAKLKSFGEVRPPVPRQTSNGIAAAPDIDQASLDWIRFREERLAAVMLRYHEAIRRQDPTCQICVPLGEAFRAQSAEFSNQDIYGLSRRADFVDFSYDFWRHSPHVLWKVDQMVRTYADITGLGVKFEIDGAAVGAYQRYGDQGMFDTATTALQAGAVGINVVNYTQERRWVEDLSQFGFMHQVGEHIEQLNRGELLLPEPTEPRAAFYVSKWTQYCFRGTSEWLHASQFGLEKLLRDAGCATRIITDENLLNESLSDVDMLILPFAAVIDAPVVPSLNRLIARCSTLTDLRFGEVVLGDAAEQLNGGDVTPGQPTGFADVSELHVWPARLGGAGTDLTITLLPLAKGEPTVQTFVADQHAIAAAQQPEAVWLLQNPMPRFYFGFSLGLSFLDRNAQWNVMQLMQLVLARLATGRHLRF